MSINRLILIICIVFIILQMPMLMILLMMMMNPFPIQMFLRPSLYLSATKLMQKTFDLFPTEAKIIAQSEKTLFVCSQTATTTTNSNVITFTIGRYHFAHLNICSFEYEEIVKMILQFLNLDETTPPTTNQMSVNNLLHLIRMSFNTLLWLLRSQKANNNSLITLRE